MRNCRLVVKRHSMWYIQRGNVWAAEEILTPDATCHGFPRSSYSYPVRYEQPTEQISTPLGADDRTGRATVVVATGTQYGMSSGVPRGTRVALAHSRPYSDSPQNAVERALSQPPLRSCCHDL